MFVHNIYLFIRCLFVANMPGVTLGVIESDYKTFH